MNKAHIQAVVLSALLLAACSPAPAPRTVLIPGGSYRKITAPALRQMLKNKNFTFINVHIPLGPSIAGTDEAIPYDEIEQRLSQLPQDKKAEIVLYCRSGHMSAIAAETLVKLGYGDVWELAGGTQAWEAAGYPLQGP